MKEALKAAACLVGVAILTPLFSAATVAIVLSAATWQ